MPSPEFQTSYVRMSLGVTLEEDHRKGADTAMVKASESTQTKGPTTKMAIYHRWGIPIGIATVGLILNTIVALNMAETIDEPVHVSYGAEILKGSPDRSRVIRYDSTMPASALNALPRAVSKALRRMGLGLGIAGKLRDFRIARFPTIFAAFALCLLVYLYAESLYGRLAGLLAQVVFIISPNIIAHSTLATTDLYSALATVMFLYCLRSFLLKPGVATATLAACTLAAAQLTKFSAPFLYLALPIIVFPYLLYSRYDGNRPRLTSRHVGTLLALHIVFFILLINVAFSFDRTFTALANYEFHSTLLRIAQQVPVLRTIPLPLPYAYLQGLDLMSYHNVNGLSFGNIVLLGRVRGPELGGLSGFGAYYLLAYALKEPLGMQVLLLLSLLWIANNRRLANFLTGEWLLLATAGVLLLMLSFFSNVQIGIRHILPVLSIFVILSGRACLDCLRSSWRRVLLSGCLLWTVVSVGTYFPHMIPYFNEILTDRKMAYRLLADSNLDWGQDSWEVQTFLQNNGDVALDPPQPVAGRILVSANLLAGVQPKRADYWLRRTSEKPIAQVGYAHVLFFVPARK